MNSPQLYPSPVLFKLQQVGDVSVNNRGYATFTDVYLIDQLGNQVGTTGKGKGKGFGASKPEMANYTPQPGDLWYIEANGKNKYDEGKVAGVATVTGQTFGFIPTDGGVIPQGATPVPGPSAGIPPYNPQAPRPAAPPAPPAAYAAPAPPAPLPPVTAPAAPVVSAPVVSAPVITASNKDVSIEFQSTLKAAVELQIAFPDKTPGQVTALLSELMKGAGLLAMEYGPCSSGGVAPARSAAPPVAPPAPVAPAPMAPVAPPAPPAAPAAPAPTPPAQMAAPADTPVVDELTARMRALFPEAEA